ncbi:hypothetical protein OH491_04435 [Termitidicoccus mucosus]|uniref:Uncharacterized protein n=1 Tax=Termitidicoccus mucosus TaxID=1184151 RepID=A0A178IPK5_9BACT|nr:hypothetical protein AW736_05165 [Opitutaceae bacterium TSB47]
MLLLSVFCATRTRHAQSGKAGNAAPRDTRETKVTLNCISFLGKLIHGCTCLPKQKEIVASQGLLIVHPFGRLWAPHRPYNIF